MAGEINSTRGRFGRSSSALFLLRRFVIRRIALNPVRLVLLITSLGLSTSLWVAVLKASSSSIESFETSLGVSGREFPLSIRPSGGRLLSRDLAACLPFLSGAFDLALVRRESGTLVSGDKRLPVPVVGIGGIGLDGPVFTAGGVLISHDIKEALELENGEPFTLRVGEVEIEEHVAESTTSPSMTFKGILLPLRVINSAIKGDRIGASGEGEWIDSVLLRPHTNANADSAGSPAERIVSQWLSACWPGSRVPLVFTESTLVERSEALLAAYRTNVFLLAGLALVVSLLLVSHAMRLSFLGVARELSILRTLGVRGWQCGGLVLFEGGVLGTIGAVVGLTVGYPLTTALVGYLTGTATEIYKVSVAPSRGWSNEAIVGICAVAVTTTVSLLGALSSAVRASRLSAAVGARRESESIRELSIGRAVVWGVTAVTVALAGFAFLRANANLPSAYGGLALSLLCALCILPLMVIVVRSIATLVFPFIAPFSGRIAARSFSSFAAGHLLGVGGLSIAVALVTALSLMVSSFRDTLRGWSDQRLQGDLFISSAVKGSGNEAKIPSEFVMSVARLQGVTQVLPYKEIRDTVDERPVMIAGTPSRIQLERGVYRVMEGQPQPEQLSGRGGVLVSESASRKLNLHPGSVFTLRSQHFAVLGVVQEFSTEVPLIIMETERFDQLYPGENATTLTVETESPEARERVRATIDDFGSGMVVVRDQRELKSLVFEIFDRTFRITTSIGVIVFFTAGAGILVSFLQYLWERQRDFKTLLALGASRLQLILILTLECALVCCAAQPVGVVAGGLMGYILTRFINPLAFGWSFRFAVSARPVVDAAVFCVALCLGVSLAAGAGLKILMKYRGPSDE